jgi:tight adherence protein C
MTIQILILIVVFGAVVLATLGVGVLVLPRQGEQRLRRMVRPEAGTSIDGKEEWHSRIADVAKPLAKLSLPSGGWEDSESRLLLIQAGFRQESAFALYFGARTSLALMLPVLFVLLTMLSGVNIERIWIFGGMFLAAGLGYYLPTWVVRWIAKNRRREIFEALPAALDLMIVCVEAGLGLDAAIARVAEEISLDSEALSNELQLVALEMRAGAPRDIALKHLATRTGVDDVDALVAMLVQADKYGTSIAESLRVHADMLRTKRQHRAEEQAAKIPLKLLFPLIFCIFPALMLVLLGPAVIRVYRILIPMMSGQS